MITYAILAVTYLASTHGANLDQLGGGLGPGGLGPGGLGDPNDLFLGGPLDLFNGPIPANTGPISHPPVDPKPKHVLYTEDPWLLKGNSKNLFNEYTSFGKPFTKAECSLPWNNKLNQLDYDDSFVCKKKLGIPEFSSNWLQTLETYQSALNPTIEHLINAFYLKIQNNPNFNDTVKQHSYRRALTRFFPKGYWPANFPGIDQAGLHQLEDVFDFWYYMTQGVYKSCKIFDERKCGSKLTFCDKPSYLDSQEKSYDDVCEEHRIDVPWITVQRHGYPVDCWVAPGQNLYYAKCHTPNKPHSRLCKFDYNTPENYVCVASSNVKRKVWAFCPIEPKHVQPDPFQSSPRYRPMFHPVLFEITTPTACSCKYCHCCRYS